MRARFLSALSVCAIVLVCTVLTAADASAQNRNVTIYNRSGVTLLNLYATNTGNTRWGRDHLRADVLESGYNMRFDFSDGSGACLFDFKFVFSTNASIERRSVDVCSVNGINVYSTSTSLE